MRSQRCTGDYDQQFYTAWSKKQLDDPLRETVLHWKGIHLANLFKTNLPHEQVDSICEIGGAEGTVLAVVGGLLRARARYNYEPSDLFCQAGQRKYPSIQFMNRPFTRDSGRYDVIILSDILEHVQDEEALLVAVAGQCRYVLIKMPIERSISVSSLAYILRGKIKPPEMIFGPKHYNAHLRGYTMRTALALIRRHFDVMEWYAVDPSFYYRGSARFVVLRRWMGLSALIRVFGGTVYILARGKC
jgi:hypothetical protein